MSRVTELAEAEAAAVEAEGEPEPAPEPEPEPTPEPEPQPQAVGEKELKALGREIEKYQAGLKRVMGDDFEGLHECPTCSEQVPGFVFEEPSALDAFEEDPEKMACPQCNGMGQLRSGAKTANALVMCMRCTGNGYVNKMQPGPQFSQPNGQPLHEIPPGYLAPTSDTMPTIDQWQRPLGHPHFGVPPSTIGA